MAGQPSAAGAISSHKNMPKLPMSPREMVLKMEESVAQSIAKDLGVSLEQARAYLQEETRKRWAERVRIYDLLKAARPEVVGLEEDRMRQIKQVAEEADIDQPTAAAVVVVGDLLTERARRRIRKSGSRRDKMLAGKFLDRLPIQQEILDLLPEVDEV